MEDWNVSDPSKDERVTWLDFDQDDRDMGAGIETVRSERLRPMRARAESKACTLIGQKLGTLFEVPNETSAAIEALLRQLESKLCL